MCGPDLSFFIFCGNCVLHEHLGTYLKMVVLVLSKSLVPFLSSTGNASAFLLRCLQLEGLNFEDEFGWMVLCF